MEVLVQWARSNPGAWESYDSADWAALPKRDPAPGESPAPGTDPGLVAAVCVQGTVIHADSVAVEDHGDGSITVWAVTEGETAGAYGPYTRAVTFRPLAPDPTMGQAINTRGSQVLYSDSAVVRARRVMATETRIRGRETRPDATLFRSGQLLTDALWTLHRSRQPVRSWREWTAGVDPSLLLGGRVRPQRLLGRYDVPKGTRTYFLRSTALANGIHTADQELELNPVAGSTPTNLTGTTNSAETLFLGTTQTTEPANAAWPAGTYRCQIDAVSVNVDLEYGLLGFGISAGHFARVPAGLTLLDTETQEQVEASFILAGLRMATTGATTWSAGASSERFEVAIAGNRFQGHGPADLVLSVDNPDMFADGPWPAAGAGGLTTAELGINS